MIVRSLRRLDTLRRGTVGFSCAEPTSDTYGPNFHPERRKSNESAYIHNTAIHPRYTGRGLVALLVGALEDELVACGYRYVERDAMVSNGYADCIARAYGARIITASSHVSGRGKQVYYKIRLT